MALSASLVNMRRLFGHHQRLLATPRPRCSAETLIISQQHRPLLSMVEQQQEWPFGLKRVDYSKPPPRWPLPVPPPPPKNPTKKYMFYGILIFTAGTFTMVFLNQEQDIYDYWRQVEQGNVPLPYDEGDDDDEEDDDDDEES